MRAIVILILIVISVFQARTQITFRKIITKGTLGAAWSVIQTTDGGYAFLGNSTSAQHPDRWLVKTDSLGDTLWTRSYPRTGYYNIADRALVQSSDGGFTFIANRPGEIHLYHTTTLGDSLWEKKICDGYAYTLSPVSGGGYVIAGQITSPIQFSRIALADLAGNVLWVKDFRIIPSGNIGECYNWSVRQVAGGGFIVAGVEVGFYSMPFLFRISPSGDSVWYRNYYTYPINSGAGAFYSVDSAQNGDFIAGGAVQIPGDNSIAVRADSNSDTVWTRSMHGGEPRAFYSVRSLVDRSFILCGQTGVHWTTDKVLLVNLSATGDVIWEREFGNYANSNGFCVESTRDGGFIICGNARQTSADDYHALLMKTDNNGIITGRGEYQSSPVISFGPNPVKDKLVISTREKCGFCLYDLLGRQVLHEKVYPPSRQIDLSGLSTGIYFYSVTTDYSNHASGKIIKVNP
jgi:hypothetical protein